MSVGTASGQTTVEIACPPDNELKRLIDGTLAPNRQEVVTHHVGECSACQNRMEFLATGSEFAFPAALLNIDNHTPPDKSKVWKSIDQVVVEVTRTFQIPLKASGPKSKPRLPIGSIEEELGFLSKTSEPGKIGRLGEFQVVRMIGRGGMGVVLHAFDSVLERDVALKVLSPELSSNSTARQRFCREARAAAAVTHDHIVAVHSVNEDEESGLPYIVMQLVSGESLEQRLRRNGKLSVQETVRLLSQAASGLAAAHATGLIHRDIKPGNMLIEPDGRLKLTDFGLARAQEDLKLTKTGYVSGTPLYMAPEQARGDEIDARSDLFSLGVVMYEALAGRPPFEGKTRACRAAPGGRRCPRTVGQGEPERTGMAGRRGRFAALEGAKGSYFHGFGADQGSTRAHVALLVAGLRQGGGSLVRLGPGPDAFEHGQAALPPTDAHDHFGSVAAWRHARRVDHGRCLPVPLAGQDGSHVVGRRVHGRR